MPARDPRARHDDAKGRLIPFVVVPGATGAAPFIDSLV